MRSSDPDPAARKFRSLQVVATSALDDARKNVLATIIESYSRLSPEQDRRFGELLQQETREVRAMISIYEERGIEIGMQRGIVRGLRLSLLRMLQARFGPLPEAVAERVNLLSSPEAIESLIDRVFTAASLDDMGLGA